MGAHLLRHHLSGHHHHLSGGVSVAGLIFLALDFFVPPPPPPPPAEVEPSAKEGFVVCVPSCSFPFVNFACWDDDDDDEAGPPPARGGGLEATLGPPLLPSPSSSEPLPSVSWEPERSKSGCELGLRFDKEGVGVATPDDAVVEGSAGGRISVEEGRRSHDETAAAWADEPSAPLLLPGDASGWGSGGVRDPSRCRAGAALLSFFGTAIIDGAVRKVG